MDLSQWSLQINGKFLLNFKLVFKLFGKKQWQALQTYGKFLEISDLFWIIGQKPKNSQMDSEVWTLIKVQYALQTSGKLFSNFWILFWIDFIFFK